MCHFSHILTGRKIYTCITDVRSCSLFTTYLSHKSDEKEYEDIPFATILRHHVSK